MRTILLACLLALGGCSGGADTQAARTTITRFHQQLNQQDYPKIWEETAPEMRSAASKQAFTNMLTTVNEKLGKHVSSKQVGWRVNYGTGASTQIVMDSQFTKGTATETFVITGPNSKPRIAGYYVNSDALFVP